MFTHPIDYADDAHGRILGELTLDDCPANIETGDTVCRSGRLSLQSGQQLDLVLTHSPATAGFMYLHQMPVQSHLFELLDLPMPSPAPAQLALPGQIILGAPRTNLVGSAIRDAMSSPPFRAAVAAGSQDEVVVLPVLREGANRWTCFPPETYMPEGVAHPMCMDEPTLWQVLIPAGANPFIL